MRILVNDYPGHPFQVQLSRALARRHHQVLHVYCGSNLTPHCRLQKLESDPDYFNCVSITLSRPLEKYSFIKRRFQEIEYGKLLYGKILNFRPEVVISANTPLDSHRIIFKKIRDNNVKLIYWVQDLIGIATNKILTKKYSWFGRVVGAYYERLEFSMIKQSDHVVVITEDYIPVLERNRVRSETIHVVYNWAPLDEVPLQPKGNDWTHKYNLHDKLCLVYSGTLGLKHNPQLLLDLAINFKIREDVRIVVISEGLGANYLEKKKEELDLKNLVLFPFQPFELLPNILGASDILLAILEADAGVFSVPSKILTYHCAGRPLLLSVPEKNLAARIVKNNRTGMVVSPDDHDGFLKAASLLLGDKILRQQLGKNARKYAENTFCIEEITNKFENILSGNPNTI